MARETPEKNTIVKSVTRWGFADHLVVRSLRPLPVRRPS